jgi:uncharacterized protein
VTELRRRPGTQRDVTLAVPVPGLAITTAHVPDDADLRVDAVLEAIDHAITLTGTVEAPWTAACRRCLEPIHGVEVIELREVFEARPTPGETYPIEGDDVDLEPVLRDAVLTHLPLAPLCREDCRGPAPDTFPAHAADEALDDPDDDGEAPRDPRWAALDVLKPGSTPPEGAG